MTTFLWIFGIGFVLLLVFSKKLRARALGLIRRNSPVQANSQTMEAFPASQSVQGEVSEEIPDSFWWRGREIQKSRFNCWPQYFAYRNIPDYFDTVVEMHKDKRFWDLMQKQDQTDRSERFYVARWKTFRRAKDES